MLRLILVSLFCLGLLQLDAAARPTHGGLGGAGVPAVCPYGTSGSGNNGCSGANQNSSFNDATKLTTAQQSGQTSCLPAHCPPFNIPGVDYPVGYDTTLTLKDPATVPLSGCTYTAVSQTFLCNSTNSISVNGYDFSGDSTAGGKATFLQFGSNFNSASTCTITNNKFRDGAGLPNLITIGGACARVIKFNTMDGSGTASQFITDNAGTSTATLDMEYNAFLNWSAPRILGASSGAANRTIKFNFAQGINNSGAAHGEFDLYGGQGGPYTGLSINWSGNFIIWDSTVSTNDNTSSFYASTGVQNGFMAAFTTADNNVIVTNTVGNPGTPTSTHLMGHALIAGGWASLGAVELLNNYIDPVGSTDCQKNGATTNWASTAFTASQAGNVLTITAFPSSGWTGSDIQAGMNVNNLAGGYTQSTIQPFGTGGSTGTGGTGTYVVDGSSQTLANNRYQLTPGITSLNASNNINMLNSIDIGINGPTLDSVQCTGAHN